MSGCDDLNALTGLLTGGLDSMFVGPDTLVEIFGGCDERGAGNAQCLVAIIGFACGDDDAPTIFYFNADLLYGADLWDAQHFGDLRANLRGFSIDAVATAKDEIERGSVGLNCGGKGARGSGGICSGEGAVVEVEGMVGPHCQRYRQHLTRLWRPHRDNCDGAAMS